MAEVTLKDIVVSSTYGDRNARLFICGKCGAEYYAIFQVVGQDHPHFQCIGCGESYCSRGEACNDPEATKQ